MGDEQKINLEKIDDADLRSEKQIFQRRSCRRKEGAAPALPKTEVETVPTPETAERKEGVMEKDDAYAKILANAKTSATSAKSDVSADAKNLSEEVDYESKITKLVTIAESQGVLHAVKVARHLEDNYVLDELHDRLLGEDLHDALVKKGMITEV